MRRERRAHNRRQKRRKKVRNVEELEEALRTLLTSHPLWEPSRSIGDANDTNDANDANDEETSSSSVSPAREWWDDARWRGGWGVLYSRWRDPERAKALGFVDWDTCAPSVDPAGSNRKGVRRAVSENGYRWNRSRGSRRRESRRDGGARRARARRRRRERDDG